MSALPEIDTALDLLIGAVREHGADRVADAIDATTNDYPDGSSAAALADCLKCAVNDARALNLGHRLVRVHARPGERVTWSWADGDDAPSASFRDNVITSVRRAFEPEGGA